MRTVWAMVVAAATAMTAGAAVPPAAAPTAGAVPGDPEAATFGPSGEFPLTASPSSSDGRFVLPVPPPPVVLTPFRPPATRYGAGHRGVDLAAPAGSAILAAGAGTVVYAGMLAGRGVVSIQHSGGLRTTYEPVTASVSAGQRVEAGQVIGTLQPGHPPCAPADCLHWGVRLPDGRYLDPMSLLRPWRVRLLPWDPEGTG